VLPETSVSVTGQYRALPQPCGVKRLSAGDVQLVPAVPAAGREDVHVPAAAGAGAHAAFEEIVLNAPAEDPDASAHADQRCPNTPAQCKLITTFVGLLIATFDAV
jgi:hypothetical protein